MGGFLHVLIVLAWLVFPVSPLLFIAALTAKKAFEKSGGGI